MAVRLNQSIRGQGEGEQKRGNGQREAAQARRPVKRAEFYGDQSGGREVEAQAQGGSNLG